MSSMFDRAAAQPSDSSQQTVARDNCPVCGGDAAQVFFSLPAVPVHCNILWPTAAAARAASRAPITLALCPGCGLVFNTAFDPALVTYDAAYENSLHCSPRFEAYADALARDLSERLALRDGLIVEVGCGKGEFLQRLCAIAGARGLGIDASYDPDAAPVRAGAAVRFVREPFSALPLDITPALVVCRHVLEHLPDPRPFMAEFAAVARRSAGCRVFVEVPNVLFTLRDLGIWDIIYEHCSYFSAPALARLCVTAGLHVERMYPAFGDQFLCVEASARPGGAERDVAGDLGKLRELAVRYSAEYGRKVTQWEKRLRELRETNQTVALWGAGSKGITFVNTVPGGNEIAWLVDLNPRKHGRFVPGTGQPVVAPGTLREFVPDVVLVMNPLYVDEIRALTQQLGLRPVIEVA
jgi:SAM-dependent methyltransferase